MDLFSPSVSSLKKKLNGVIFSPTKLFPAQFINDSDHFFLQLDPNVSNVQLGVEINGAGVYSVYTSLLSTKEDCLFVDLPTDLMNKGMLVVKTNARIKNVEIDREYKNKLKEKGHILFQGIGFGNVTLSIVTTENKKVDRVIHLHEGIAQYIPIEFELLHKKRVEGYELKLMASREQKIDFTKISVRDFYNRAKFRKSNKEISFSEGLSLKGFKRLIEINDNGLVFLNSNKNENSFIKMDDEYLKYFLKINNFDNINELCLVHFPVDINMKDATFIHSTGRKEAELDVFFLNKDGSISSSLKKTLTKFWLLVMITVPLILKLTLGINISLGKPFALLELI